MIEDAPLLMPIRSLKSKVKELGIHFLIYGIGSALQGLVTFLLLPLLSKYFSVEDYGKYTLIVLAGTLLGSFFFLGGQTAITRFYFEKENENYQAKVVTNTTLIMIIGASLCILIGSASSTLISRVIFDSSSYWKIITISSISAAFGIINTYLITYLRIIKKSTLFVIVNLLNLILNFTTTYLFLKYSFFENNLIAPFVGSIIGLLASILLSTYPIVIMFKYVNIEIPKIKSYIKFSFPIVLMGLIYYMFDMSDRFVMENSLTLSDVGIYSFGYKIGTIINLLFVVPFALIFSVLRMEYVKDKFSNVFFSRVVTYYTMIGFSLVVLLVIFTKVIIYFAASSLEYQDAFKVTPWVLVGTLILGYAGIFDFGIYLAKKTYYYLLIYGIIFIFNITLNLLFLKYFGYQFAAINKTISYLLLVFLIFIISQKYYVIVLEKRFFKLTLSGVLTLSLIQIIMYYDYSFYFTIIIVSVLGIYWYFNILNLEEKSFIKEIRNQIFNNDWKILRKKH